MELPDELLCLFTGQVENRQGSYVIEVPQRELDLGRIEEDEVYRIGVLPHAREATVTETQETGSTPEQSPEPPVEKGEVVDVEIEDIGEQGDGIARVGPGYVVIVPETELNERVSVEITEVQENVAFAVVAERHDRM